MIPAERRAQLIKILNESGFVQIAELANQLASSPVTIRRDLLIMEKEGILIRKRGGAVSRNRSVTLELPYAIKQVQHVEIKRRIAEAAIHLIEDGKSLILDSGSTTHALAQRLTSKQRLSVVTNDLQIAIKLAANPDINLICTGGIARSNVYSLQGVLAENCIRALHVDITFLGADAIHTDASIYNVNLEEVPIKLAMIQAATKVILLSDSSKFEVQGFSKVCDLSEIDVIITDSGISRETREMLRSKIRKELIIV